MAASATVDFTIDRFTLDNGLRVVLSPDRSSPVVAIAVYYDVGFRSEPEGRTGFAHLFEHLMFQGSENLGKMEHIRLVTGNGGTLNGSTSPDYTNYYEALPAAGLELGLFLEADRMRSLRITQENLDNQIAVVQEEIRVNVLNRPYGGFPWIHLAPLMFDTFANSHNGYGSFVDLASARLDDARDFFEKYYAPGNAVLAVTGDLDLEATREMIERLFGDIPARATPSHPSFSEPVPTKPRRATHDDPLAPTPAVALGYRVPDPIGNLDEILALDVMCSILTDGESSLLQRRLIRELGLVTAVDSGTGVFSHSVGPLERDPSRLQIVAFYPEANDLARIVDVIDTEIAAVIAHPDADHVRSAVARRTGSYLRTMDSFVQRALAMAPLEMFRGKAEMVNEFPKRLAAITPDAVSAAAAGWLQPSGRSVLEVVQKAEA